MTKKIKLPPVGMRVIKSAIGVFLGFVIYELRGRTGIPFYTALSVLWCIRPYKGDTMTMALQRTIGTFIGGMAGLLVLVSQNLITGGGEFPEMVRFSIISLMIIPIIYLTVLLKRKNASYFACVVFLSVTVLHMTDANPYIFVLNRMIDTEIGILLGMFLNTFRLPYDKRQDILFVSGVDDTLLSRNNELGAYSKWELNRMLDEGAKFTLSTMRTPASIMDYLHDIRLRLPIICMDGAVLYDIRENCYLEKVIFDEHEAERLCLWLRLQGMHVFINRVIESTCMINYGAFNNYPEQDIYETMRKSPYRNYVGRDPKSYTDIVYLMMIDTSQRIENLYEKMRKENLLQKYKVLKYPSRDYTGYSYIKIYHPDATREKMMQKLANRLQIEKVVTFGSIEGKYDVVVHENDSDKVVKTLRKLYEPVRWFRTGANKN